MPLSSSSRFVAELGSRFADVCLVRRGSRFTIYDARDMNTSRPVTIKLPNMSSGVWLHDVLEHEGAILTAAGAHPYVLSCHELHWLEDGRPALLLERCTGSLY